MLILNFPKILTLSGFALIGLAIISWFMAVLCGLGGSGSCDGDSSTFVIFGLSGMLAIAISPLLNKEKPVNLANLWLLFWILVVVAIFAIDGGRGY